MLTVRAEIFSYNEHKSPTLLTVDNVCRRLRRMTRNLTSFLLHHSRLFNLLLVVDLVLVYPAARKPYDEEAHVVFMHRPSRFLAENVVGDAGLVNTSRQSRPRYQR
jgi:hypothetical protein